MTCKCQECDKQYKVDIIVPDTLWEKIKPDKKTSGAGLLCGNCIFTRIEQTGEYAVFNLTNL